MLGFEELKSLYSPKNDTTYVVHFFASWCAPCLKELPIFVNLMTVPSDPKVKVLLVSLDAAKSYETALVPLIEKFHIPQTVLLLTEPNPNRWIGQVDKDWSGTIPCTLIVKNKGKVRRFFEHALSQDELIPLLKL